MKCTRSECRARRRYSPGELFAVIRLFLLTVHFLLGTLFFSNFKLKIQLIKKKII